MGREPRVDRSPEEKWQLVQEGMKRVAFTIIHAGRLNWWRHLTVTP